MKFKVGDKVLVNSVAQGGKFSGMIGTVIDRLNNPYPFKVDFGSESEVFHDEELSPVTKLHEVLA